MSAWTGVWIARGTGLAIGALALVLLFGGNWGAFLALSLMSAFFVGAAWVTRRLFAPREGEEPAGVIGPIALVAFGGAGLAMVVGSGFLLADGEPGGLALTAMGLVFCGGGYMGWRVFSIPKGTKAVVVAEDGRTLDGAPGQLREVENRTYVIVDEKIPDAELRAQQRAWAEKPWTRREDWARGEIEQEGVHDVRALTLFTVLWNVVAGGIAGIALWSGWQDGDVPWFVLIFPAVGVALGVFAFRAWRRKRKFGASVLRCRDVPAWLGDRLRGTVHTGVPVRNDPGKRFRVRLSCVRRSTRRDREDREHVSERRLWEREEQVRGIADGRVFQVPIDVAIPADQPPSELSPEDDRTLWRLTLTCEVPGVDYLAVFEVPVFALPLDLNP